MGSILLCQLHHLLFLSARPLSLCWSRQLLYCFLYTSISISTKSYQHHLSKPFHFYDSSMTSSSLCFKYPLVCFSRPNVYLGVYTQKTASKVLFKMPSRKGLKILKLVGLRLKTSCDSPEIRTPLAGTTYYCWVGRCTGAEFDPPPLSLPPSYHPRIVLLTTIIVRVLLLLLG